jgi:hypothetical protein
MAIDKRCYTCGFYDPDFTCTCPHSDKWYACPISPEPDWEKTIRRRNELEDGHFSDE